MAENWSFRWVCKCPNSLKLLYVSEEKKNKEREFPWGPWKKEIVSTGQDMEVVRTHKCGTLGLFSGKTLKEAFIVYLGAYCIGQEFGIPPYKEWGFWQVGWKVTNLRYKKKKKKKRSAVTGREASIWRQRSRIETREGSAREPLWRV